MEGQRGLLHVSEAGGGEIVRAPKDYDAREQFIFYVRMGEGTIRLPSDLTGKEYEIVCRGCAQFGREVAWNAIRLLRYGRDKFGDNVYQYLDAFDYDPSYVRKLMMVADRFDGPIDGDDGRIGITTYIRVCQYADLDDEDRRLLLRKALEGNLTRIGVDKLIEQYRSVVGKPDEPLSAESADAGSIADKAEAPATGEVFDGGDVVFESDGDKRSDGVDGAIADYVEKAGPPPPIVVPGEPEPDHGVPAEWLDLWPEWYRVSLEWACYEVGLESVPDDVSEIECRPFDFLRERMASVRRFLASKNFEVSE